MTRFVEPSAIAQLVRQRVTLRVRELARAQVFVSP